MFMDRIGLRCERNAALKNKTKKKQKKTKKIPNEINLKQKNTIALYTSGWGGHVQEVHGGFQGGVYDDGSVQQEDF